MIRRIGDISSKASPKRHITHLEIWARMEDFGWFRQNAPWIEVTIFSGLGAVRSQVRATRFLSKENKLLLEGVHSIVEMPVPSTAKRIEEVESPQARYSHEFWLLWPDDGVWILGQLKKRPKHHDKLPGYSHGLTEVKEKTYGPDDTVVLDGYKFVGCRFNQCSIEYSGGETDFVDCLFDKPDLLMADEAANTVNILNALKAFSSTKFSVLPEQ
jgi:hypothetical protein